MNQDGIPLPLALSGNVIERLIKIDEALFYLVLGALVELTDDWWLEQTGTLTADDAKLALMEMLWCFQEECLVEYPEHFWINPMSAVKLAGTTLSRVINTGQVFNVQAEVTPSAINNAMQWQFFAKGGRYDIHVVGARSTNYARVTIKIDGNIADAEQDFYNAAAQNNYEAIYDCQIGNTGNHTLDLAALSKNASSTGYRFLVSAIWGVRTGDI